MVFVRGEALPYLWLCCVNAVCGQDRIMHVVVVATQTIKKGDEAPLPMCLCAPGLCARIWCAWRSFLTMARPTGGAGRSQCISATMWCCPIPRA